MHLPVGKHHIPREVATKTITANNSTVLIGSSNANEDIIVDISVGNGVKSTTSLKTGILGLLALRICFSAGVRSSTTPQPGTAGAEALTSESLT